MDDSSNFDPGNRASSAAAAAAAGGSSTPAGFCQECGRSLTSDTVRRVAGGVYCLPCAQHRPASDGWQPVNASAPPRAAYTPRPGIPGAPEPNPVLAGFFGAIPGVGAMYNGQYAKGAMHLLVFVVLVTLADNLNWVLWWLVWGWIFYQIFEAYHTARARRDGLPLPNPFGWNDLGERLGFHRTSPPERPADVASPAGASASPWTVPTQTVPAQPAPSPAPSTPNAATSFYPGYNPYTAPSPTRQTPVVPISPQPPTSAPYSPTYTGVAPGQTPAAANAPTTGSPQVPVGAFWLIGLGGLFLLGNVLPTWRLSGRWMAPVLLAAVAVWSALRRWSQLQQTPATASLPGNLANAMAGPILFGTVAGLLGLQAANLLSLRRSWPVLLVVWGSVLLMRRSVVSPSVPLQPTAVPDPAAPPVRSTSGTGSYGL